MTEPREPSSTEGQLADADHVDVLVEDLFIEDYKPPPALSPNEPALARRGRLSRAVRPIRANAKPLVGALLVVGLALAALVLVGRRRKVTRLSRLFSMLGFSR